MNRGKDYARQRHDSAHAKNRVEEAKDIRILGDPDNAPHDFRYTLSGNASKTITANHDIDARLDTYAKVRLAKARDLEPKGAER